MALGRDIPGLLKASNGGCNLRMTKLLHRALRDVVLMAIIVQLSIPQKVMFLTMEQISRRRKVVWEQNWVSA